MYHIMRKYINLIAAGVFIFSVTSCKKSFLEVVPKGNLVAKTYQDYNLLMNSSAFYVFDNNGIYEAAMIMGDDVAALDVNYNSTRSVQARGLFNWDADIFLPGPRPFSSTENPIFLRVLLTNIYTCNKIINEVMTAEKGTEQQKLEVLSEAKAQRAFIYIQILNYFGKPYAVGTASTDPGWPIVTATEIAATNFKRNTVQEVYDFMIKDLSEAIPNLRVQQDVPTRMSKAAAEGILGKLYLFMGKTDEALDLFNKAFTDIAQMGKPPKLYDYNVTFDPNGGSFLPINPVSGPNSPYNSITDMTESVVCVSSYAGSYAGNGFGNNFLLITPETAGLFDPADWRLKFYTNIQQDQVTPIPNGLLRKYGKTYVRAGLELPELYLLRAEAKARKNDLPGARADVEMLRRNRMPVTESAVPAAVGSDQMALIKFILEERIREFAAEGYRWFDQRRLSVDPKFQGAPAAKHHIYLTGGGRTEFTLNPLRLTLKIPSIYLKSNPEMTDNP